MSKHEYERFNLLSENILIGLASKDELEEFQQLLSKWNLDKELNIQLSVCGNKKAN